MSLYNKLMPLPSDYFGISSVLYEFGGLVVIYGPAGGAWHINIEDEPRWYRNAPVVLGAGLLEMDVILGKEEVFIEKIVQTAKDLKKDFVSLIQTPVSTIIGADLEGMAREIELKSGVTAFSVNASGISTYQEGASKAMLTLIKKFVKKTDKKEKRINLLGNVHLDVGKEEKLKPLVKSLEKRGYEVTVFPSSKSNIKDLRKLSEAEKNVVISSSALESAEYMHKTFDIPYLVGFPIGEGEEFFALLENKAPEFSKSEKKGKTILVIGEGVRVLSLKKFLNKTGFDVITVSLFSTENFKKAPLEFLSPGENDFVFKNEKELENFLNKRNFDAIIADPLYKNLLDKNVPFVELPHIAVSARFYWNENYDYVGKEGEIYFKEKLKSFL